MIVGAGIDIIEISRIKSALRKEAFVGRIFTPDEQSYCNSRGVQRTASFAARFAGKEAVMKAFGTGLSGGSWQDIEILPGQSGQPQVRLSGFFADLAENRKLSRILVSLSHSRDYAVAQAILWGDDCNETCIGS